MKRRIFVVVFLIFFVSCTKSNFQNEKEITLSSGSKITVAFEKKEIEGDDPILSVDYKTDERKIKEDTVEKEALEIWSGMKSEAEKLELTEALIRYSFNAGEKTKEGKIHYHVILFEATRIESGEWTVRKVN